MIQMLCNDGTHVSIEWDSHPHPVFGKHRIDNCEIDNGEKFDH